MKSVNMANLLRLCSITVSDIACHIFPLMPSNCHCLHLKAGRCVKFWLLDFSSELDSLWLLWYLVLM